MRPSPALGLAPSVAPSVALSLALSIALSLWPRARRSEGAVLALTLLCFALPSPSLAEPTASSRLLPIQGQGVSNLVETENLRAQLIVETATAAPGGQVDLALVFEIRPHWHTYWKNPGDSGEPPRLTWRLPEGVKAGPIQWTYPSLIRVGPLANYGYSDRAVHLISLSIPRDWRPGEPLAIEADATWLVCEEHCIPEQGSFALSLETAAVEPPSAFDASDELGWAGLDDGASAQGSDRERANLFATARAELPVGGTIAASLERNADSPMAPGSDPVNNPRAESAADLDQALGSEKMRLSLPAVALPSEPRSVRFFADEWGLLEHAAPQRWQIDGDRLQLVLTPGEAPGAAAPTGLLVVEMASGAVQEAHKTGTRPATDSVRIAFAVDASTRPAQAAARSGRASGAADRRPAAGVAAQGEPEMLAGNEDSMPGLPLALTFALLGGLILNLMPCVFPVLAIKALSLAQQGQQHVAERVLHGLAYTAGVLSFFALVALLLLALRAGGAAVGWGFQLQSPAFVALMAYLFLTLGLSLSGAITIGTRFMGIGATTPSGGHLGAYMTGALAALVAAPCTAPFMGAALGYALAQPWPVALSVVLTLGLGMALPFLLLALSPALARRLPRPGAWMETLKQFLAFPMFATTAWLLWVLSVQTGPAGVGAALAGLVLLAFGLWLFETARDGRDRRRPEVQVVIHAVGGASLAAAFWLCVQLVPSQTAATPFSTELPETGGAPGDRTGITGAQPIQDAGESTESSAASLPYTPERLDAARAAGRPIFVNMTAAWCITCLVNERVALAKPAVAAAFAERDLLYLKGDWTKRDAQITQYLSSFGRSGVPLYVYYPPGGEPQVLPQVLTESIVLNAL